MIPQMMIPQIGGCAPAPVVRARHRTGAAPLTRPLRLSLLALGLLAATPAGAGGDARLAQLGMTPHFNTAPAITPPPAPMAPLVPGTGPKLPKGPPAALTIPQAPAFTPNRPRYQPSPPPAPNSGTNVTSGAGLSALGIGTRVPALPGTCSQVMVNGLAYSRCGSNWFRQEATGGNPAYRVVPAPSRPSGMNPAP